MVRKFISIFFCLLLSTNIYAQNNKFYTIKGQLKGVKDGIAVYLTNSNGKRQIEKIKNGRFIFNGEERVSGVYNFLTIDSFKNVINLIIDIDSSLEIIGDVKEWSNISIVGTKSQIDYIDFLKNIQEPYTEAYDEYSGLMKFQTGKNTISEWINYSKNYRGEDSLKLFLAYQIYQNAVEKYYRKTLVWIILHPDSLCTPNLILRWWPRMKRKSAYDILSPRLQNSYYGRMLKEEK